MYRRQRPLRRVDIDYLVDIDSKCFARPWRIEHWEQTLKTSRVVVVTHWGTPVGYVVVKDNVVVRFAVKPNHQRKQLGTKLLTGLKDEKRPHLNIHVPEECLYLDKGALGKFLTHNGFVAQTPIENETVLFIWRRNGFVGRTEPNCHGR